MQVWNHNGPNYQQVSDSIQELAEEVVEKATKKAFNKCMQVFNLKTEISFMIYTIIANCPPCSAIWDSHAAQTP